MRKVQLKNRMETTTELLTFVLRYWLSGLAPLLVSRPFSWSRPTSSLALPGLALLGLARLSLTRPDLDLLGFQLPRVSRLPRNMFLRV